jgi:UDP-2,3-diacylglucosamine pyrophosphatase LpxH
VITRYHTWIARTGDLAYELTMHANHRLNQLRRVLGMRYWSLSAFAKKSVKNAVNIVSEFEQSVAHGCRRRGLDDVVCGHIHKAASEVGPLGPACRSA